MRPVNLIPSDERRDKRPVRTGPIAYLLVGALALGLAAVTMVVLTNNKIADRKAEIAGLEQREAAASARAAQLAPFAEFSSLEGERLATIKSLANSRFDWERVLRELALVIPSDVWLTDLRGAVNSQVSGSTDTASASGAPPIDAPSLSLSGCATGQEAVARFLSALRDIDGITRVGLTSSERPTEAASAASGEASGGDTDCRTFDFITKFEVVAAFDAVPTPDIPAAAPSGSTATPTSSAGTETEAAPASETTASTAPGS